MIKTLSPEVLEREDVLVLGNLRLDFAAMAASVDGSRLGLTLQEFELLARLAKHPGRMLPLSELTGTFWHEDTEVERKRLSVIVAHLRRKLGTLYPYRIETIRMRGYGLTRPHF